MNILLLSAGGGGGNIVRSLKASFKRDLAVTQQSDSRYAERLRRAVTTRFLDTNEFALSDVPKDERFLIGTATTGRLGARHDPDVARHALNESRSEVEALFSRYSIVILVGTGGKGTGAGTMFPLAQMAREQKKLVIPIFVRPSFERHEVDKRHYDHAVNVIARFDSAGIRLIEILNDRGYVERDPQSQPIVWERMNLPIARGLRGLIYVLWDLSQVDPSDLSVLFAGNGRLRIGFAEIDPPAGSEPSDDMVEDAARRCCDNPFYAFHKPPGTSLICIQGDWSNVVDAKIKGRVATAMGVDSRTPYSPLYARAVGAPKPWGVTALFAEYTGTHRPLEVDWALERGVRTATSSQRLERDPFPVEQPSPIAMEALGPIAEFGEEQPEAGVAAVRGRAFATFWEFAVAVNRSDPAALALASDGATSTIPIDGAEVKKLVSVMWFRTVLTRLSGEWRERLLAVLVEHVPMSDHQVKLGRHTMHLRELSYAQLQEIDSKTSVPDAVRADLDLLMTVGRFWGADAVKRFRFVEAPEQPRASSKVESLLDRFLN
jgi:cell division GTPase FtsZ